MRRGWMVWEQIAARDRRTFRRLGLCSGRPADSPNQVHLQFNYCTATDHHNVPTSEMVRKGSEPSINTLRRRTFFRPMARPLRIEYPGAIYHVLSCGDRREAIFRAEADRKLVLDLLGRTCRQTEWQIRAYSLMPLPLR
jgi:hypothetical protein